MKYFENCQTAEELKQTYKIFAKKLHPDCNADHDTTAEFQEMQAEFERTWESLKNVHMNKDGKIYNKETEETAQAFMDMINRLIRIPGVKVEMCGSWIWVTGDTKAVKEMLKEMHFCWSAKKQAWYYHEGVYFKRTKNVISLDQIRQMYGSTEFEYNETAMM